MSAEITVSLVSFRFCADPAINLDRHGAWLNTLVSGADTRPDLVLFPEFSLTGWTYDPDAALELDSPLVGRAVGLASEFATVVGFGLVERHGGVRYNSFVVAGPDGVAGVMRKINLTPAECRHFQPGHELPVIEVSAGRLADLRLGVAICADATRFEMIHLLSLRGAEVILAPHANSLASYGGNRDGWIRWRRERWPLFARDCAVAIAGVSCAGRPAPEMPAVDDAGDELPRGETGELWIWGVMNFKSYWNRPDATAEALTDGWVHTGDVGHMDEDDYVHITDRAKDMILRGGENIGCQEVEAALYRHPGVAECAVFGVPDERLGEAVAAVVSVRPDAPPSVEDLKAHTAEHLAKFKVPEHLWLRTERLPRIASEKIFKRQLRDEAVALLQADGRAAADG